MAFCPSCGKQIDDNATFCPYCGANVKASQPPAGAQPPPTAVAGKERPLGVTIIAVLDVLAGLLLILAGGAMFGVRFMLGAYGGPMASRPGLVAAFGVLFVIVGLVTVFLAWGLWNGSTWAWTAALVIAVLSSILHLLTFNIIGLIINVIVIVYLLQANVKLYFGR
ncbi:MAG TPA: zinc ribbon domain-containing protein [Conexivisphaerales archaeon]|nr:zinc ribbon domain-containing protein [Conexivisphaerales archaeon]